MTDPHGHDAHGAHGAHDTHGAGGHGGGGSPRDVSVMIAAAGALLVGLIGGPCAAPAIRDAMGPPKLPKKEGHGAPGEHGKPKEHGAAPSAPGAHRVASVEPRTYPRGRVDHLLVNARVTTLGTPSEAAVVAIKDGKVFAVGGDDLLPSLQVDKSRVHDLRGAAVVPGLRDAHGHLRGLGRVVLERECDLSDAKDLDDLAARVAAFVAKHELPAGAWVIGTRWDQTRWPGAQFPDSTEVLDKAAGGRPALLFRVDGHAAFANARALELAGVDKAAVGEGGQVLRDKAGKPTGILIDTAIGLVEKAIPDAGNAEVEADLVAGALACARAGLVEVHDAGVGGEELAALERLANAKKLPIRVYAMHANGKDLEKRAGAGPRELAGGRLVVRAIKLVADGAMGSRGAFLLEPYADPPAGSKHPRGNEILTRADVERVGRLALAKGLQLCVHAIGDAANRSVLDAFEALGLAKNKDLRWRIEHAQLVNPGDRVRFAKLGVIASMQPRHATSDMRWAEARVGAVRLEGAYAWRSMLDSGVALALGSDFPVEPESPLLGLYSAVTRQDEKGEPRGGWRPQEKLTPEEALRGFTLDVAYASFAEKRRGTLEPGMDADLTVLDGRDDLLETLAKEPARLLKMKALETWVAGERAWAESGR